jgi:hypothetical protein
VKYDGRSDGSGRAAWVFTRVLFHLLWHFVCHFLNPVAHNVLKPCKALQFFLDAPEESYGPREEPSNGKSKETKMSVRKEGDRKAEGPQGSGQKVVNRPPALKRVPDSGPVVTVNPLD